MQSNNENPTPFVYRVKEVCKIIDGDTVDLLLDLGFGIFTKKRVRLWGIDTPEIRTRDLEEKRKGYAAKERLSQLINEASKESLILHSNGIGKYGRVLGTIYNNNSNLNMKMVSEGHAEEYE